MNLFVSIKFHGDLDDLPFCYPAVTQVYIFGLVMFRRPAQILHCDNSLNSGVISDNYELLNFNTTEVLAMTLRDNDPFFDQVADDDFGELFRTVADLVDYSDDAKAFAKLDEIVDRQAVLGEPISYEAVCKEMFFPLPNRNWINHRLYQLVRAMDEEDKRLGRPRRCTIFVRKGKKGVNGQELTASRLPGKGYFKYPEAKLGRQLKTARERREVFLEELARLIEYYRNR